LLIKLNERDHIGDLGGEGRIILKYDKAISDRVVDCIVWLRVRTKRWPS